MKLKKSLLAAAVVMALGSLVLAGCGGDDKKADKKAAPAKSGDKIVLRYAEIQPADYPTTKAAYKFSEIVKEKTKGRIQIDVYHSAQLGDEKASIEQIQFGGIDFTRVSITPLAEFNKALNALALPYLYRDADHMWKVLDGKIGDDFLASMQAKGIVGLSWYDAGARNFYNSKHEVKKVGDLPGLKIRVQESALMMDMVKALGASPTPMAYGEVYSGLQTKVIDGAENNAPSYQSTSHYEVAKYYVLDEHSRIPEMQLMAKATMDKLSKEDQAIIRAAAKESSKYERQLWAEREKAAFDKVTKGGATITKLDAAAHKGFEDAVKPLYDKYGKDYKEVIDKIRATK